MGVAPIIEDYLLIREDFIAKCNKLSIMPQHLIPFLLFQKYKKVKEFPTEMANWVICRQNFCLAGVTPPSPYSRNGPTKAQPKKAAC